MATLLKKSPLMQDAPQVGRLAPLFVIKEFTLNRLLNIVKHVH